MSQTNIPHEGSAIRKVSLISALSHHHPVEHNHTEHDHGGKHGFCEQCDDNPGTEPHTCPYGDESLCNCCDTCVHECAMDI